MTSVSRGHLRLRPGAFLEEQAAVGNPVPDADAAVFPKASRNACTPDVAIELSRMWAETDVRSVLPTIQTPTLCLSQTELHETDEARQVADLIPGAELVQIAGRPWTDATMEAAADEIRRFVRVERPPIELDTVLATVLFTDIVRSTETQAALGDHRWKSLIERYNTSVRAALQRWRGVEHDTAGDGFYATFDGPARGGSAAHLRSLERSASSVSRSERVSTPESARSSRGSSEGSPHRSARGSLRTRVRQRSSCPRPSKISSPGVVSHSSMRADTD